MKKIAILAALIFILSSCSAGGTNTQPSETAGEKQNSSTQPQTQLREDICFDFLKTEMIIQQGGVRTNYLDTPHNKDFATGGEVLSESMGLLMLYAVEALDEALFKNALGFVEESLDTGKILSYRYAAETGAYHVNAFIDDIRIIRALILADDVFDGQYSKLAKKYADRLYDTNVINNCVFDMYDETYNVRNDFVTLCYIDLYTIQLLQRDDAKWEKVFEYMHDIIKDGYINDTFPMYVPSYSYATKQYQHGDINTVEATLTALNLARIGECPQSTVRYLKDSIENGAIYGSYSHDGTKQSDTESTAVYAICALIAKEVQDEDMYKMCIDKMNRFQVMDENSEVYGAFANPVTLDLYSFDNLMALLAYSQG